VDVTSLRTQLALAACWQGRKVRFYNVAGLVNDLTVAQDEIRLPKLIASSLKHDLIVLDELGLITFSASGSHLIFQFCSMCSSLPSPVAAHLKSQRLKLGIQRQKQH
jgi:DNA replication protein DnaC